MAHDNVVTLHGSTRLDLPPRRILDAAIDADLETVLVIGIQENGELYAAGSTGELGSLLILSETFKHKLLSGDYK